MRVNIFHKLVLISHVKPVVIWVFRRIKIPIIILYELIDFIKVIRIRMFALNAKVYFDRFGKSCALSAFVLAILSSWCSVLLLRGHLGLRKFLILRHHLLGSLSKLIELQNFSQLACVSTLRSSLTCFCN